MIRFGTGGWRAEIGRDFTEENVRSVAQALCDFARTNNKAEKPIVIGYDHRFLSKSASEWIAQVVAANGIKTYVLPRSAPTPLIMHTVMKRGFHYGIEVTASHNPPEYNGIKVIIDEGRDADVKVTDQLERIIAEGVTPKNIPFEDAAECGMIEYIQNPFNDFIDDILSVLDKNAFRKRGLRVLFNPMHGSATYPINVIFNTLRCTIDIINLNKDAYFGGLTPAPNEETLNTMDEQVVNEGYDLGFGVDGDGDRLGVIDNNGRYIDANEILVLLYYYLHEYKGWKGPVVRNLATTHMLDKIAHSFGEECYEVPIGFKWISSKIDQVDAVLGGESSGGLTVRGHIHGKDSVYAVSLFAEMICVTGKTPTEMLDELYTKYGKHTMVEFNLRLSDEQKPGAIKRIMEDRERPTFDRSIVRVNYEDGCKVYFEDDSFVICRFSGTEPVLRIFAEATERATAQTYIDKWKELLGL